MDLFSYGGENPYAVKGIHISVSYWAYWRPKNCQ